MIINTQKTNIHKINNILESNLIKVQTCKVKCGVKDIVLIDAIGITASDNLKNKSPNDIMIQYKVGGQSKLIALSCLSGHQSSGLC